MPYRSFILLFGAIVLSIGALAQEEEGSDLSYKRYSDVAFLITNNAYTPFHSELIADQSHTIAQQLDDDVDGLVLNVDLQYGQPVVYYRSTILGSKPLADILALVKTRLNERPDKILTLLFNSKVPISEWSTTLFESGLMEFVYLHPGGKWPTIGNMVDADQRLVLFTMNEDNAEQAWIQPLIEQSKWASLDICSNNDHEKILGANMPRDLLVMEHHVDMKASEKTNGLLFMNSRVELLKRAQKCWELTGNIPNLILVDHYDIGQANSATNLINNISDGLTENVDPSKFEIVKDPLMKYSTIDFRGYIRKDHKLEIWEIDGMQVASVRNAEYDKMYIPVMSLAYGEYHYRVVDPEDHEILTGEFLLN